MKQSNRNMSYSEKLAALVLCRRALVACGLIINVDGHFVRAVQTAVTERNVLLPQLPRVEDVDAGLHPEVATWIENAVAEPPAGLYDVNSADFQLSYHGDVNGTRAAVSIICDTHGLAQLQLKTAPMGKNVDSLVDRREDPSVGAVIITCCREGFVSETALPVAPTLIAC